ncbi:VanZ family protein [Patescibacteria group bacterium]|nr:VanZ family protein [Patescibacteria group bacterium]
MIKFIKYWLPVLVWAGFIFYLSSRPGLNSGMEVFWDVFSRKLGHAAVFGFLFLLIFRALRFGHKLDLKKALIWSLILAIGYAFFDEAHQYFVLERQARLKDVGMDSLGIATAACFKALFKK